MIRFALLSVFLLGTTIGYAQQDQLQNYLQQALGSNIALQQKQLSYQKSLAALEEAKALFYPNLSLQARYSVARGGRAFELPIGDLMNPVYDNLNLINQANSGTIPDYPSVPDYPQIANEEILFLRPTEQETTIRLAFPVFNAAIINNHKIKKDLTLMEGISVNMYKRTLVKEVKTAYYQYQQTVQQVQLFEDALALVQENLRTTESLYRYNKQTIDVVYAAEAEVKKVERQIAEAIRARQTAEAYFNFLLNRPYDEAIEISTVAEAPQAVASLDQARSQAVQQREEMRQLDQLAEVASKQVKLNKEEWLPNINLVADYGVQGTNYRLDSDSDFFMGSLVMSWNIFNRPTQAKVQQAQIEQQIIAQRNAEAKEQIGLEVVQAHYALESSRKSIDLSQQELKYSQKAYQLVEKKFKQGQANLVELTNARTQQTQAAQKLIIARFDFQTKMAEYEHATASYIF